jgi:unsaturated chondroitin disaccharide hydrolase
VAAAREGTRALDVWAEADTATRGLVFWYPLVLSRLVTEEGCFPLEASADRCVFSLAERFSPRGGVVPWGEAFGGTGDLIRVDGAPGVAPLMCEAWAATQETAEIGARHLVRHLRLCWDGRALTPVWRMSEKAGPVPEGSNRYWSRGRAWLLTGFADALRVGALDPDDPALTGLLNSEAPLVPAADTSDPGGAVDTGAAAIEAAALLRLASALSTDAPLASRARERAHQIVLLLARDHLAPGGTGLVDGSYEVRGDLLTGLETVWGDFFLALSASVVAGVLPNGRL